MAIIGPQQPLAGTLLHCLVRVQQKMGEAACEVLDKPLWDRAEGLLHTAGQLVVMMFLEARERKRHLLAPHGRNTVGQEGTDKACRWGRASGRSHLHPSWGSARCEQSTHWLSFQLGLSSAHDTAWQRSHLLHSQGVGLQLAAPHQGPSQLGCQRLFCWAGAACQVLLRLELRGRLLGCLIGRLQLANKRCEHGCGDHREKGHLGCKVPE